MLKSVFCLVVAAGALTCSAADLAFDFARFSSNSSPTGFVSTVSGQGQPGVWRIVQDEVPSAFEPLSQRAPESGKRSVLAQLSQETTDEHFPVLIYAKETFGDFKLTTRFKCVSGSVEQMAGIAFRIQDEKNFYVVRASALGNTFRFYKVVNGERSVPIGPQVEIPGGVWHELSVECKGNQIRCALNGKELIPMLTDNSFSAGKIGFWTKSDAVSYFVDTKINFTPRVPLAQVILNDMMARHPRLIGLKLFSRNDENEIRLVASNDQKQIGELGADAEEKVITTSQTYYAKAKESVSVIMPLRDRNGETIAALRVILKPFPGQTQLNAHARALPIVKAIEERIISTKDLRQ